MKDLLYIDFEGISIPQGSTAYERWVKLAQKKDIVDRDFVLCYNNIYHKKVIKHYQIQELMNKNFFIPFIDNMEMDSYEMALDTLRAKYFPLTVGAIPGLHILEKEVAEMSPHYSQICAGALLIDKRGRTLVLVKKLEDGHDQFYIPQSHVAYTQDIYTKSFEQYICDYSTKNLNDAITLERSVGELEPVSLISGYIVNTAETIVTAMHTLFVTVFQVDDFENYNIRCRDESQTAMILELDEAVKAAGAHMMDPWLTFAHMKLFS